MSSSFSGSVVALGAVVVALAGCGGGIPSDAVVSADGKAITKTTFNHWMSVAAASSAATPGAAKPAPPVPPNYTACIAHLKETAPKPAKGKRHRSRQAKRS